ncbi:MAG: hypothetical protein U1E76_21335 [Planctomycetota bacterium]
MKRRIVLSLCSVLLTLGAIEIALRAPAAQVWLASQFHLVLEPFRAFEEVAENGATYVQKRKLEQPRYSVHDVRFAKHKAPGRVRVFTFGGSTTYGMPYTLAAGQAGDVSFGTWLREDVKLRGGVELEVINCGAIGMPVEGVRDVVQECFDYEPDVFLVLSGHNEFLPHALLAARSRVRSAFSLAVASPWRKLRLVALLEQFAISLAERNSPGVGTRDYPIADSPIQPAFHTEAESAFIEHRYQQTLQWIVAACRARHVQLVLGTPPGNLKDFEPSFSTLHAANDAERERWLALLRAGRAAVESGDAERGGELLARAVAEHLGTPARTTAWLALAARADAAARAQLELRATSMARSAAPPGRSSMPCAALRMVPASSSPIATPIAAARRRRPARRRVVPSTSASDAAGRGDRAQHARGARAAARRDRPAARPEPDRAMDRERASRTSSCSSSTSS